MHNKSLAHILDCTALTEEQINLLVNNQVLQPLRKKIAEDAGTREMIDVLMQHLINTDWDAVYEKVVKEEQERLAYYEALDKAREEEKLNEPHKCYSCKATFPLRETQGDNNNPEWVRFCNTCFETNHITCILCQKNFITSNTLLNTLQTCLECKRHEIQKINHHNLRTKRAKTLSNLDILLWIKTLKHFQSTCAYCGGKYQVLEHYLPLELGGNTTIINCLPSCHKCNLKKSNKHPNDFEQLFPSENIAQIKAYFASIQPTTSK